MSHVYDMPAGRIKARFIWSKILRNVICHVIMTEHWKTFDRIMIKHSPVLVLHSLNIIQLLWVP